MKATLRTPLALLVLLVACDSGSKDSGNKATASADAKAEVKADVQVDTKAVAAAAADAAAAAEAKAGLAADAAVQISVPPLKPVAEVEAALGGKLALKAADLDLAGVVALVARGELRSAAELELFLNAAGGAAHRVELDVDGKLDYLQVVEVRADHAVRFELRAIPSSKLDASLAVLVATLATVRAEAEGAIDVVADYSAAVEGGAELKAEHRFKAEFKGDAVVLADAAAGAFVGWAVDVARPAYLSVHVAPVDIELAVDGAARFIGDASASIDAARLAALRAAVKVEALALAAVEPPKVSAKAGAKAKGGVDVDHSAKAESSVKVGSSGGVSVGGGSVKVGGSIGGSIGGGAKGKAGAGIKIGQ